jgi:predicted lipoprotein with Yx(FWY)xxD motif
MNTSEHERCKDSSGSSDVHAGATSVAGRPAYLCSTNCTKEESMKKRLIVISTALLALTTMAAILAVTASASVDAKTRLNVRTTSLGKILVTSQGRTLYLFAPDKHGKSTCYGSCASYWPPLLVTGKPTAGPGVKASLLGVTVRKDGKHQATYNGHPLYSYVGDTAAGKTSGQGLNLSGGLWWVVSPAGQAVKSTTSSAGGGGGYGGGGYGG